VYENKISKFVLDEPFREVGNYLPVGLNRGTIVEEREEYLGYLACNLFYGLHHPYMLVVTDFQRLCRMDVMVTKSRAILETFRMVLLPVLNILIVGVFMKSQLRHEDMVMGYLKFVPDGMGSPGTLPLLSMVLHLIHRR